MKSKSYNYNVFINSPFDKRYKKLFRAIIFSIIDCGFNPRCTLEVDDSSINRLNRILKIIENCKYGIHDISKTSLDAINKLPRFNMPLELGLFLSAKHFGQKKQTNKNCIVLDKDQYRYQKFISDISGMDIKAHCNEVEKVIPLVRNWLSSYSKEMIPSGSKMSKRYIEFLKQLSKQTHKLNLVPSELTFGDFVNLSAAWIEEN